MAAPISELSVSSPPLPARTVPGSALRVLQIVNRLDLGGTELGVLKVIRGLGCEHFTHAICTAKGHRLETEQNWGLAGSVYDASTSGSAAKHLVLRFARVMRTFRPHIVHSRNWGGIEAVFAARLARVPVVIHSEHGYELEMLEGEPLRRRLLRHAAYAAADAVFAVTRDLRSYHARVSWTKESRIRVLANGVDTGRFCKLGGEAARARIALGLPPNSTIVGSVGRLVPIKDHVSLLKAVETLVSKGSEIRVVLAGDGPEKASLESFVANSPVLGGRVHFLGDTGDVPQVLRSLDIFVLPSISEGMSNTLLEAMSCGLPVVASRVGGNRELLEDSGVGLLFEPRNVSDLAEKLSRLLDESVRQKLGTAARSHVLSNYSLEDMMQRYRELYRELAARRGILEGKTA
jgi:sugar transferase (PEP-CTERM/EpsH1 system associated)